MHDFYHRIQTVMQRAGSNRSQFCRKYGYKYQTLQAFWDSDKLPPGNVLEDLAKEFNVSLDALVLGRSPQDFTSEHPVVKEIVRFLAQQDEQDLLRIEGAIKMLKYLSLAGPDDAANRLESLTDLLTGLSQLIQQGNLSPQEKETSKEMLNRIVLNVFERRMKIKDEWAELEEIAP